MTKKKITVDEKEIAVKEYMAGECTLRQIAAQYNVHHSNISKWVFLYQIWGREGLHRPEKNMKYTKEFKKEVVQDYMTDKYSLYELCRKYKIRNISVIQKWISNSNLENINE